jgi:3-dehydroquinate dehydratase
VTRVHVLNGPNLGRLGTRQVDVYGLTSYAELVESCETAAGSSAASISGTDRWSPRSPPG